MENRDATIFKDTLLFAIKGEFTKETIPQKFDDNMRNNEIKRVVFDLSACHRLDSAGAIALIGLKRELNAHHKEVAIEHETVEQAKLLQLYEKHFQRWVKPRPLKRDFFEQIGFYVTMIIHEIALFFSFFGELTLSTIKLSVDLKRFRGVAFVRQIYTVILGAIPIVSILSFLIGLVIAYQATGYLVKMGGEPFLVEISVMSVFRELSPMIAAIMIAARSASAFTAEIGTMQITQEIDAMRTMGFDPFVFLVIPRVLALTLLIPLVIFCADMAGVLGSFVVATYHVGMGAEEFISLLYHDVHINELYVGLGKAPIYGAIVAIIGCYMGFRVDNSTESIGKMTTKSVVFAIFWVIVADSIIAVALTKLGI